MSKRSFILPWLNWGITTSFVLFQFFLQATSGLMAKSWIREFHLTSTQLGSLSAAFFISYVLIQIPVGMAYDRLGARKVLIGASIILTCGIFSLALSQTYLEAFLARMLMGLGSGFGFVGMLYITASWFSGRQFAMMVGLAETLAMMGVALGEIGMAWMITHVGWRMTLMFAGLLSALVIVLVFMFIHDQVGYIKSSEEQYSLKDSLKKVVLTPQLWIAGLYGFAMVAIINVFSTLWGVSFILYSYHPISLHTVSSLIAMSFVGLGIGGPFVAWLVKRFGRRRLFMILFSALTTFLLIVILYVPRISLWKLYLLLLALGFFSAAYIQVFAVVKESVSVGLRATALSTVNMIIMSSSPIMQPLIGKAIQWGYSYAHAISLLVLGLIAAVVASFFLERNSVQN